MRFGSRQIAVTAALAFRHCGCGNGAGSEPTEAQMKEAMDYGMNHPPGETVSDPIKIVSFKKEACDAPTPQGYRCTFDIKVASRNIGTSMYNNINFAFIYKDNETGKWSMRPPF